MLSTWYSDHFRNNRLQVADHVKTEDDTSITVVKEEKGKRRQSVDEIVIMPPAKKIKLNTTLIIEDATSSTTFEDDIRLPSPAPPPAPFTEDISVLTTTKSIPHTALGTVEGYPQRETIQGAKDTAQESSACCTLHQHRETAGSMPQPRTGAVLAVERLESPTQRGTNNTQESSAPGAVKRKARKKSNKKKTINSSKTAQNLCAKDWLKLPGHEGMTTEFDTYWEGLGEEGHKRWDEISKKAVEDSKTEKKGKTKEIVLKVGKVGMGSGNGEGSGIGQE
ncbi:hypothetical protein JOM56_013477 [Amanita muscaria]